MSDKIKLLFCPSDIAGVGHFRCIWPAQQMEREHSDDFEVEVNPIPNYANMEYLKQFDIIHFHRDFGPPDSVVERIKTLQENGVIVIMDVDDYWQPPKTHPLYHAVKHGKIDEKIMTNVKLVDYVTTTTSIFARYVKKYNKNVEIIPNALDLTHRMWKSENDKRTKKVRISWIGGSSHMHDLEIIREDMKMLHECPELKDKYQIVMCGYDVRGSVTQIDERGAQHTRKIEPHESIWNQFEEIFTNNHSICDEEYTTWLKKCSKYDYPKQDIYQENYVRRWTLPLTQYGKHYDYTDICLAPLQDNTFNEVKSELKIIESGMKGKALIAQDYAIYKELMEHGHNGLLIGRNKKKHEWFKAMKLLILDNDLREELSNNLHDMVSKRYGLKTVTKKRVDFYKSIVYHNAEVV